MTTESAPQSMATAPGHAGPWRLVARLGAGAFGSVWRAEDAGGRVGVVKLLRDAPGQEVRALSRLYHPAVVGFLGAGTTPVPYLVMTLAPGAPLDEVLAGGRLPVGRALSIVATLADALAACHLADVPHGDLKPANVMVTDTGVTLVDFGLSGQEGGTPRYAAPEVLDGSAGDPRADVYSLGLLAYELLHGALPGATRPLHEALTARRRAAPAATEGPAWVRELVHTMLAPDPGARPTAAAVADAFDAQGCVVASPDVRDLAQRATTLAVAQPPVDAAVDTWLETGGSLAVVGPERSGRSHALRRATDELRARGALVLPLVPSPRPFGPIEAALVDPTLPGAAASLPDAPDPITRAQDAAEALLRRVGRDPLHLVVDDVDALDEGSRRTLRALVQAGVATLVAASAPQAWVAQSVTLAPWTPAASRALLGSLLGAVDVETLEAQARDQVGGRPGDVIAFALGAIRAGALRYRRRRWVVDRPMLEELDPAAWDSERAVPTDLPASSRRLGAVIALMQPVPAATARRLAEVDEAAIEPLVAGDWVRGGATWTCRDLRSAAALRASVDDLRPLWTRIAQELLAEDPVPWARVGRALLGAEAAAAIRTHGVTCVQATQDLDVREAAALARGFLARCPTPELAAAHVDACVKAGLLDEAREAGRAWLAGRSP